jgi:tetratricopeptide (TPR) repeat protein
MSVADRGPEMAGQIAGIVDDANRLCEAGEAAAAVCLLDGALAVAGFDPRLHTARGWALENLEVPDWGAARDAYERALLLDAGQLWARGGLAEILRRQGDPEASQRLYRQVADEAAIRVATEPDLAELLGWSLYRTARTDEAITTFRSALAADGGWVSVRLDLGLALLIRGDVPAAAREYDAAFDQVRRHQPARIGALGVALEDLDELLARRRELAVLPAAAAVRDRLRRAARSQQDADG